MKKLRQTLGIPNRTTSSPDTLTKVQVDFQQLENCFRILDLQRDHLSNLTDKSSKRTTSGASMSEKGNMFCDSLTSYGERLLGNIETQQLANCFLKLTIAMRVYESFNNDLNDQMIKFLQTPMQNFLKKDIPNLREQRKTYEKKVALFEAAELKLRSFDGRPKKEIQNDPKYFEAEQEYNAAKLNLENCARQTIAIMNMFNCRYEYQMLENLSNFSEMFSSTLTRASTAIAEVSSQMNLFRGVIEKKKALYQQILDSKDAEPTGTLGKNQPQKKAPEVTEIFNTKTRNQLEVDSDSSSSEEEEDVRHIPGLGEEGTIQVRAFKKVPKDSESSPVVKEGWLSKKRQRKKKWHSYYFVLKYKYLLYYSCNEPKEDTLRGWISLSNCCVESYPLIPGCFSVNSQSQTYFISAKNDDLLNEWLLAIKICIEDEQLISIFQEEEDDVVQWAEEKRKKSQEHTYEENRRKLVEKLLISERNYVHTLNSLTQLQTTLSTEKLLPKQYDEKVVFANINLMFGVHREVLSDLESALESSTVSTKHLASLFLNRIGSFSLYGQYVSNYSRAHYTLNQSMKNSKFSSYIKVFEQENGIDYTNAFSQPLNRNVIYEQFLENLIENTQTTDPGFTLVTDACEAMKDLSEFIDQSHLQSKQMEQLFAVSQKISGCTEEIAIPGRRLIREGWLIWRTQTKDVSRYFFLFNDLLIEAKKSEKLITTGYNFKSCVPVSKASVRDMPDSDSVKNSFILCINTTTYNFSSPSASEKELWVKDINRVICSLNSNHVFRTPLAEVMNVEQERNLDVPYVIYETTRYIRENGLTTEGIFRLSGSHSLIENYREIVDQGEDLVLDDEINIHNVSGLLKLWLRELPEPPIPWSMYATFVEASKQDSSSETVECFKKALGKMPTHNRNLLLHLLSFLYEVVKNSETNKMNLKNLAIVFGPILLSKKRTENELIDPSDFNEAHDVVSRMLEYYPQAFEESSRIRNEKLQKTTSHGISKRAELSGVSTDELASADDDEDEDEKETEPLQTSGGWTQLTASLSGNPGNNNGVVVGGLRTPRIVGSSSGSSIGARPLSLLPGAIVKEGFLSREGAYHRWKPAWFVLKYKVLLSYNSPKDPKPKSRNELLSGCIIQDSQKKQFAFNIILKTEVLSLCGKSQEEADEWKDAIRSCIEILGSG